MGVATTLCNSINIVNANDNTMQKTPTKVNAIKDNHKKTWVDKNQHGFIFTHQQQTCDYNEELTQLAEVSRYYIPYRRIHMCYSRARNKNESTNRQKRTRWNPTYDKKCCYCHNHTEDTFHLLSSCSHLSASLYLPVHCNEVAKVIYNAINMFNPVRYGQTMILKYGETFIKTVPTVPHNKSNIVVWKKNENKCFIIGIRVPLDENIHKLERMKINNYTLLTIGLHRLYQNYSYRVDI